jgi:hypothetical protein
VDSDLANEQAAQKSLIKEMTDGQKFLYFANQ